MGKSRDLASDDSGDCVLLARAAADAAGGFELRLSPRPVVGVRHALPVAPIRRHRTGLEAAVVSSRRSSPPPFLFEPTRMSGSVFAAVAKSWPFKCSIHLEQPFASLTGEDPEELRAILAFS